MILFISSWSHEQAQRIAGLLGHPHFAHIDPHALAESDRPFGLCIDESGTHVFLDNTSVIPSAIYWNTRPRSDAALAPEGTRYPSAYRSRLTQFVNDISFALEGVPQFPGTLQAIERAESKPLLQRAASAIGLQTPSFLWNAIGSAQVEAIHERHGRMYRKVLGPPCVVTEDGRGVTTTNLATEEWRQDLPGSNHPWQYQNIVPFVAQIRCQVVGTSVWAARWEHAPHGNEWDLRYHQEILGEDVRFNPVSIDDSTSRAVSHLVSSLGLSHAAPEFLERADGSLVFIDLNPCGDWMGFFPPDTEHDIASALAGLL